MRYLTIAMLCCCLFVVGCEDDDSDASATGTSATAEYIERKATYLDFCHSECESECGIRGVVCRVAKGSSSYNTTAIDNTIQKMDERRDTADFDAASMVRILFLNDKTNALLPEDEARIRAALLDFTWWNDQINPGKMVVGTENHQILFHSGEYLVGQRWPNEVFTTTGMTGQEHFEAAKWKLMRWLDLRGKYGFNEWHSNIYFNEDIPALANLAEFAEDPEIANRAKILLDIIAIDMMTNMKDGLFATTRGRTYPGRLDNGLSDSTDDGAWLMFGAGNYNSRDDFSAAFLSTSENYYPMPILENLAKETAPSLEHRQRDGWTLEDGEKLGINYTDHDDVMLWTGLTAFLAPPVIQGFLQIAEDGDLWDNAPWSDFPSDIVDVIRPLIGNPLVESFSTLLSDVSRGMALEEVNTYTYRTPHYQLSGAQNYKPGQWSGQTLMWLATIDQKAYTTVISSGHLSLDISYEPAFASDWTGGWHPKATMHKNVGIFQFDAADVPIITDFFRRDSTHAYWDRDAFDEQVEDPHWIIGRKGDAYMGLWSQNPTTWNPDMPRMRVAQGTENVWIVEMGSADEHGSFSDFVSQLQTAPLTVDAAGVRYESPSLGVMETSWDGPLTVNGAEIDLGPYERFDNPYVQQIHEDTALTVTVGDQQLTLDAMNDIREVTMVTAAP